MLSDHQKIESYASLLSGIGLFAGLDRVSLSKLAAHLDSIELPSGSVLVCEGDPGDAFYLVADGSFGVFRRIDAGFGEARIRTLGPGDPLGEMALLTNSPRTATVRADTNGEVLRLERARFLSLVGQEPSVALAIAATLSRRLGTTQSRADAGARVRPAITANPDKQTVATVQARPRWRPNGTILCAAFAVMVVLVAWLLPPPSGLSPAGWKALATLIAVVPALALSVLPEGVLALLLATMWIVGGVAPAQTALIGFASPGWILVVCVLVVGGAIASTGILYRLALWTVAHSRGGFTGQVLALSAAGVLMGPAVPNATGRVIFIAPMIQELVEALGYEPQSREAAGLAMASLIGFGQIVAAFMTSSTTAVLVFALLQQSGPSDLNWLTWAGYAAPTSVILFFGLVATILWIYRPRGAEKGRSSVRISSLELQRALLGPTSRKEWVALAVGIALLLGFITQPLHGLHPAWVAVLALATLAALKVVNTETLRTVNWSFALLFGILASIADVFSSVHVDEWLATVMAGMLGDLTREPVFFVAVLTMLCFGVSLIIRWQASAPLITIALTPVAVSAGINPLVVGLVAIIACNGFFLPYQSTTYLALYHGTDGQLFTHAQARPVALAYGVITFIAMCASVPAWQIMGLFSPTAGP